MIRGLALQVEKLFGDDALARTHQRTHSRDGDCLAAADAQSQSSSRPVYSVKLHLLPVHAKTPIHRHTMRLPAVVILLVGIVACATAARTTSHKIADRNVIESAEVDSARAPNLLEVVRQLRPEWLRRSTSGVRSIRGGSAGANGDQLNVYVDEVRHAGTSVLAQINPNGVTGVRYYTASEAQIRFGEGNTAGVIHIVTRSAARP